MSFTSQKAPNPNLQAPEKFQTPNNNPDAVQDLKLDVSLELGA
jgi:hypothetical protein